MSNFTNLTKGQVRILKAVATLLEDTSKKITINEIAREIHLTNGAIYRHYRSKEDIFEALMGYMESNLLTPLSEVQQQSTDTKRRLEAVFTQYMTFLSTHPGLARLLLGHGATEATQLPERIKLLNTHIRAQLSLILKFGEAQGVLKNKTTPEQAAELFYGLLVGTAMGYTYDFPQITPEDKWDIFTRATLR